MQDDIGMSQDTKDGLEAALVGHAFVGNMGDVTTITALLGKTNAIATLEGKMDKVIEFVKSTRTGGDGGSGNKDQDPIAVLAKSMDKNFKWLNKRINTLEQSNKPTNP
jgi:hypothetical protein|tara:strand:- start:13 stop:336 length:324 start_codon:yes stop_codon:yes gene_type:complete